MMRKTGFTLVELMIAVSLVGMIILVITAVDLASRRFVQSSNYEAKVQNSVSPILEMMVKDIARAYGQSANPGIKDTSGNSIFTGSQRIEIRQLDSAPATYSDYTDDAWRAYGFDSTSKEIRRYDTCNSAGNDKCNAWGPAYEVLAKNITVCNFTRSDITAPVSIGLTALHDAAVEADTNTNPQVTLETSIFPGSSSTH